MKGELEWLKEFIYKLEIANDQVPDENYKFWDYMKMIRIKYGQRIEKLSQNVHKASEGKDE